PWSDPEDYPGLAHFCEHMLFLGTTKYPIESEYDRYLTENGGTMNAYTANDHTNYTFAVKHEAFTEALDRFSWFFKEPLFNESGVDREVNAIDQEYAKNVPQDLIRQMYIAKELGNPKHPSHAFNMGNKLSLAHANPEVLRKWYDKHYSAHLMHLVIYSKLPIQQLVDMVEDKFAGVPRRDTSIFRTTEPLFGSETKEKIIYYSPLMDLRTVSVTWELPGEFAQMIETHPDSIVGSILGHEDEDSLLAQLKREDLAEGLSAGGYRLGEDNFAFRVSVSLTDKGIRQTPTVLERIYQTIAMLRETPPEIYTFNEVKRMEELRYQYQSREDAFDFVTNHAREMLYEALETYPMKSRVTQRYDAEAIKRMIALLTPESARVMVTGKPALTGRKPDRQEKWVGGDYSIEAMNADLVKRFADAKPHEAIHLSPPNPFIPQNLQILGTLKDFTGIPHPKRIRQDEGGEIYFQADQLYLVPEIVWKFRMRTPQVIPNDDRSAVLADLWVRSFTEQLNSLSYTAMLAGLQFAMEAMPDGVQLTIQGYSEKAQELFDSLLAQLRTVRPTDAQFRTYRNSLRRQYENFRKESPFKQGYEELQGLLYRDIVTVPEKARAVRGISYEDFLDFSSKLFRQTYVEGTLYGNMRDSDADKAWTSLRDGLGSVAYPKEQHNKRRVLQLPKEPGPFFYAYRIKEPGNAVILTIQNGPFSFEARAAQQILAKGIQQPFYTELRTKQQTGYIVYNWASELERQLFSHFAVQSNTHDGRDLLARFELLVERFLQEMENEDLTEERFEIIRDSSLTQLKQPPKNSLEMTELLHLLAVDYEGDFDWMAKRIQGLESLTYPQFTAYAKDFLGRGNHRRLAILVEGELPPDNQFAYRNVKNGRKMRKLSEYEPAPTPCQTASAR
ncbi:MAG: insulinase family protein, partial [Chlamydiia bacterium]|nr:insulinase family protein [Chlamydiia bacterium]